MSVAQSPIIIFDTFFQITEAHVRRLIRENREIYVLEPFIGYHRTRAKIAGYPLEFPDFVSPLIQSGQIKMIRADQFGAKTIYGRAADQAVEVVEAVFKVYRKRFSRLQSYLLALAGDEAATGALKNHLCQRLAEFYGLNILLSRLEDIFPERALQVFADADVLAYECLKREIQSCSGPLSAHSRVTFPAACYSFARRSQARKSLRMTVSLFAFSLLGLWGDFKNTFRADRFERYRYGITLMAPARQLKGRHGRVDFLVDGKSIRREDVVYFVMVPLTDAQTRILEQTGSRVVRVPSGKNFFRKGLSWLKLALLSIREGFLSNDKEFKTAYLFCSQYFIWCQLGRGIKVDHLITHCDFGPMHMGRNAALKKQDVTTWYFTDSANMGCNMRREQDSGKMRHPFWTYLYYDHFVTWSPFIRDFFAAHPHRIRTFHVIGCLWGQESRSPSDVEFWNGKPARPGRDAVMVAAFDTTYSLNGFATYKEGFLFAEHLFALVESDENLWLLLKEKKEKGLHSYLDKESGAKLMALYERMASHPRIVILTEDTDVGAVMDAAALVVSFPFTSTTFEALSCRKKAIWHDPLGFYRETVFGQMPGVMTHNFDELARLFADIRQGGGNFDLPAQSPAMDPFLDGKAIDRFRALLVADQGTASQREHHSLLNDKVLQIFLESQPN